MSQYNQMMIHRINSQTTAKPVERTIQTKAESFSDILNKKLDESSELQFSKHATSRIGGRDIDLTEEQLKRVEEGVKEAGRKGIKDSLVLVDGVALLVNVNSKTVVTAMKGGGKNVFTNIDGAVIV